MNSKLFIASIAISLFSAQAIAKPVVQSNKSGQCYILDGDKVIEEGACDIKVSTQDDSNFDKTTMLKLNYRFYDIATDTKSLNNIGSLPSIRLNNVEAFKHRLSSQSKKAIAKYHANPESLTCYQSLVMTICYS